MRLEDAVAIAALALVTFRLARAIAIDKIGEPLRGWLYRSGAKRKLGSWAFALITCPYCIGTWIALLATGWWVWLISDDWPGIGTFMVVWFATAGLQALLTSIDLRLIRHE
jgi:Protein of unknown function (DUF1360)